jgi:type II secretory pathway component PulM
MDRIRELRARLSEQLEALSTRDRNLFTGLVLGVATVFVGLVTWSLLGVLDDRASRVRTAKDNLNTAQELATEHAILAAKVAAAEARMGEFRPTQVNTYVESWASEAGVLAGLKEVRETSSQTVGTFRERDYRVDIQGIPLDGVVRFLYRVETSPYPIKVRAARFKVRDPRRERTLDLDLELSTFSKEEG